MKYSKTVLISLFFVITLVVQTSFAEHSRPLLQFDAALKDLTAEVSPAVVQILVSGYGPITKESTQASVFVRQQSTGSGVILDPNGYIVTNAHVIKGAERIQVILYTSVPESDAALPPTPQQSILPARIVGMTDYFDLALLKVEASGLPTLAFADFNNITQGQLVVAMGSPMGLTNSATMGIISSVARQADSSLPIAYVQTDAPINPGNSGGALVDVNGHLVGINSFILTEGGGSEGLGFALPAPIVEMVYRSLREKGHVDRRTIGIGAQQITPTMAQGLGLSRLSGLIVCDVLPGGPAEKAGIKVGDVVTEGDGRSITTPPQLDGTIYTHDLTVPLKLVLLRGTVRVRVQVEVKEVEQHIDVMSDPADPQKNIIRQLGVMAAPITQDAESELSNLRIGSGAIVVARTADPTEADLQTGDVIHAVNNVTVQDFQALRTEMNKFKHGDAVVLQIERERGLQYMAFEIE